jgi:hypothetical protein
MILLKKERGKKDTVIAEPRKEGTCCGPANQQLGIAELFVVHRLEAPYVLLFHKNLI